MTITQNACVLFYYYIYIFIYIYIIVIFYSHTKSFLSYCHIVTIVTQTPVCPRGRYTPLACRKPAISIRKNTFRFLQKIVSRPAGSKQEKKLSRLTDFYTLAPPAVLHFPQKAVSLYQQTRELEARFSSRPIRRPVPSPSTSLPESFRKLETDRHFCLTKKTG